MAHTINPAVCRTRREWLGAVLGFLASTMIGSVVAALMVVVLGGLVRSVSEPALVATSLVLLLLVMLRDLGIDVPVPYRSKQVPEAWRAHGRPGMVAVPYGLLLGFGFTTPFLGAAHLAAMIAIPWLESITAVALVAGVFALGRGSVLLAGVGTTQLEEVAVRLGCESPARARGRARRLTSIVAALAVLVVLAREVLPL